MNGIQDLNLNSTACIKNQSNIGSDVVHNICTGKITIVPWGSADWLGAIFLSLLLAGCVAMFVALGVSLYRGVR